jgi:hypothetical protein
MIAFKNNIPPERIFLVHSKDYTGHRTYYFLHIDPLRQPLFENAMRGTKNIDLEDFGDIIASGYGEASSEIRAAITRKYGWQAS